ncbi:MAG TPA: MFS transporter [Acidimicrobiales bacterium]|jgi:fucose permease
MSNAVNTDRSLPPNGADGDVSFPPFAFASATGVYILMGAVTSLFGPLLESFAHRFHLSLASAGLALSVYFVGASLGVLPGWLGLKRVDGRLVLGVSLISIALGAAGASLSHWWPLFLTSVFIVGLGFGALDLALNTLMTRTNLQGRAHRLSVGNAGYGVGAVICPIIIVGIGPHNFPTLFAGLGVLALLLSVTNRGLVAPPQRSAPNIELPAVRAHRRQVLATFIFAFIFYTALETGSSGWMATQIHGVGYSESIGSLVTAGFWTGMALGRSLGGPLHRRFAEEKLVLGGLVTAAVLCLLAFADPLAPFAYPLLGLIIASIFPMGLLWYTTLCPGDSDGLSWLLFFTMFGGVAGPGIASFMVSHFHIHVVPGVLACYAVIDLAIFYSARRFRPLSDADLSAARVI